MDALHWDTFLSNSIDYAETRVRRDPNENPETPSHEAPIPCKTCRLSDRLCRRCRQKLKKSSLEFACSHYQPSNFRRSTALPLLGFTKITVPIRQMAQTYGATGKYRVSEHDGMAEPCWESSGDRDESEHYLHLDDYIESKDKSESEDEDKNENEKEEEDDTLPTNLPLVDLPTPRYMRATMLPPPQQQPCLHFMSERGQSRVVFTVSYARGTGSALGIFAPPEIGDSLWHRIWSWWVSREQHSWTYYFQATQLTELVCETLEGLWKTRNRLDDID
ncbi:hypothetical protein K469DRAFT_750737 [Zopfia rhizophila CBS 207.26]|uniref:Uncharacterized protein n=1 Tax=Zopfia rhizophila CBS 207.26 TaxID=1314779 RepID=A0A6A6E413_9PEZI|nr:hypothetical protein K469DRAFT_750737 [Zopfia rhizophila CBS 207.26]